MGFVVGETVGPYKITAYVGQGGMATIFKAYHATLDRYVALKVIHPALKEDRSFINRLRREAAIIARLNHPNIVTVYDFSEFKGTPFLVLRFIEGKTLRDILREQRLSTRQILNIIRPVADALTYAHSRGVLHRDVKPSNVLIDTEGHVFLTDFGLARLAQSGESTASQDMLIGSPHYISPEQAKSEPVGVGTDIYSLGVILYEMFAGRVPFSSDTPYATILAQINEPPPSPRSLNPKIPPAVERVLLKSLAKEPRQRYASIREMMRALENAARGPRVEEERGAPIPLADYRPSPARALQQSLAGLGDQIRAATTLLGDRRGRPLWLPFASALLLLCFLFACLVGVAMFALQAIPLSLAATTRTATVAATGSVRPSATIPAPARTSPTASAALAPPVIIAPTATRVPASPVVGAARGKIAYSVATGGAAEQHAIWLANADGSDAHLIIEMAMWPSLSPDGKQIAYYRLKDAGIYIANLDGSHPRRVVAGETCCVEWAPEGKRIVYLQGKLKVGDTKIFIANVDGTGITEITPGFNPAWSPDGNRLVYAGCQPNTTQCGLFVYDLKTKNATLITRDNGASPKWSPRGDRIVYQADDGKGHVNLFLVNPDGSGIRQLTFGKSNDGQPNWSVDGNHIFWRSDQDGKRWGIFVMRADGTGTRLLIDNAPPDGNLWARESLSAGP